MDGSHAFDFPLGDLSPGQHAALDAALERENIQHQWLGSTLQVDVAFESRVTTLVDQARGGVLPAAPTPAGPPPGYDAPTAQQPITGTVVPGPSPAYGAPQSAPYPGASYGGGGYSPPAGYGYPGYGTYPVAPPTNGLATAALVLGLVSLAFCVTGIPAVICGHMARGQIRASNGTQGGDGMALAGLILGYVVTGIYVVFIVFYGLIAASLLI